MAPALSGKTPLGKALSTDGFGSAGASSDALRGGHCDHAAGKHRLITGNARRPRLGRASHAFPGNPRPRMVRLQRSLRTSPRMKSHAGV